jgi:2-iminobutanoate/2-iminopropanoate deaminase
MSRAVVTASNAPAAIGPYSHAVTVSAGTSLAFCSGCIGIDSKTGELAGPTIEQQTERTLDNLKAVVEAAGSTMGHVVKTTILLRSLDDFAKVNTIYAKYFPKEPPARATYGMDGLAPLPARVPGLPLTSALAGPAPPPVVQRWPVCLRTR